jgi:hypothetical protein
MFSCGFIMLAQAGEQLDAVNQAVAAKAAQIDQKHGVLLDSQERNELKMDLIVQQVLAATPVDANNSIEDIAATAIATYQIDDISQQRRLLFKLETQMLEGTGAGGTVPDYP